MKFAWLTDMNVSGYRNLSVPLCEHLANNGHTVRVMGIGYDGEEHFFPFSIISCEHFDQMFAMVTNLLRMEEIDTLIVALDLSVQEKVISMFQERKFKYWGIFPVEAPPLQQSWVNVINRMDKVFVLSEFGTEEVKKHGIHATHLQVGVDTEAWKIPVPEERVMLRGSYGIAEDEFLILTVADNQERKFLSRTAQIVRDFKKQFDRDVRWILVTRIHLEDIGWRLQDLITDMGLVNNFLPLERGMSFKELWSLYAMADCFLITSKTEGVGIPALEAMACGVPVVATNVTGLAESMRKGGGFPIAVEQLEDDWIDPFGNSHRWFASIKDGVRQLNNVSQGLGTESVRSRARGYVQTLQWKNSGDVLLRSIENAQA